MTNAGDRSSIASELGPWRTPQGALLVDAEFAEGINWDTEDGSPPEGWTIANTFEVSGCRTFSKSQTFLGVICEGTYEECCTQTTRKVTTPDGVDLILTTTSCETKSTGVSCTLKIV